MKANGEGFDAMTAGSMGSGMGDGLFSYDVQFYVRNCAATRETNALGVGLLNMLRRSLALLCLFCEGAGDRAGLGCGDEALTEGA